LAAPAGRAFFKLCKRRAIALSNPLVSLTPVTDLAEQQGYRSDRQDIGQRTEDDYTPKGHKGHEGNIRINEKSPKIQDKPGQMAV
jgi:hypothetical protein